jgi:hypothetical protein
VLFNNIVKEVIRKHLGSDAELVFSHPLDTVFSLVDTSVDGDVSAVNIIIV